MTASAIEGDARPRAGRDPGEDIASALGAAVGEAAARAAAGRAEPTLVSVIRPVDPVDPVRLFAAAEACDTELALWLQPAEGIALLGIGAAWSMGATGAGRHAEVEAAWARLTAGAIVDGAGPRGSGPVLLGGFGFADTAARTPTWRGFEGAHVVLPELLLTVTPDGAWLTVSRVQPAGDAGTGSAASPMRSWQDLLMAAPACPPATAPRRALQVRASRPAAAEWRASVSRLAGAVGRGRLDKVVLARQVDLEADAPIEVAAVIERLRVSAPESTLFAIRRSGRTFLGASPERLVRLDGRRIRSVAMAGSIRRGGDPAEDAHLAAELLASDKEREEHAVVVDMLRATLAPLCEELSIPSLPHVERLRHLQHLVTPVEGRLRDRTSVLRLAAALHPTPAVGGMPRDLALELIAEEETHERGWYAGPLGWVDGSGDGELVVALRSGVVDGSRATLFAGCGIVADSDPDREWQESTTKLQALGSALGRVER